MASARVYNKSKRLTFPMNGSINDAATLLDYYAVLYEHYTEYTTAI